jgi:hypothetical protein
MTVSRELSRYKLDLAINIIQNVIEYSPLKVKSVCS